VKERSIVVDEIAVEPSPPETHFKCILFFLVERFTINGMTF
jgi:hypothetical protein